MPSKSEKQHNAMEAAAHGNSALGIPASVAQEFIEADKAAGKYVGKKKKAKKSSKKSSKK
jgi:hypothetical protein